MSTLADLQVTVVGLGLMGASLAGALRGQCRAVVGVARRSETAEEAVARGLLDRAGTDLAEGVREADLVVLATPVRTILRMLDVLAPLLPAGCVLMDLGSTKAQIVERMAHLPATVEPLGAHPMCGRESSGLAAADPGLYHGCLFVLSPLARTSPQTLSLGRALVGAVGGTPLVLDAERHDRLVAIASHLPYLLACTLVAAAEQSAARDRMLWQLCASGFRDTSRLAACDVTMMLDILLTNRPAVLDAVQGAERELHALAELLAGADEERLRAALAACRARRQPMFHATPGGEAACVCSEMEERRRAEDNGGPAPEKGTGHE